MNNLARSIGLSAAAMTLFACSGDDVTKVYETNNTTVGLDLVDKGDEMPDCDKDSDGKLIFVADSGMAYFCSKEEWLPFGGENMKGEPGEEGEKGDPGDKGPKGDKGAKGAKGDAGESCTAKEVEDGIEVSCGGKVVGTLNNGATGESCSAKKVEDGIEVSCGGKVVGTLENGAAGESCTANAIENVGVEISCGGVPIDTLTNGINGDCAIENDENGVVSFICGNGTFTVNKAQCAGVAYDPSVSFCLVGTIVALTGSCDGKEIDQTKQFCDTRDGQAYNYVVVDVGGESQVWMAQNLNYAKDLKGTSFCSVDDGNGGCDEYGRLYDWWSAADVDPATADLSVRTLERIYQGICPEGWHLPNSNELEKLFYHYGMVSGITGASTDIFRSKSGWTATDRDNNGTDELGLSFVPSGTISGNAPTGIGQFMMMWGGSEIADNNQYVMSSIIEIYNNSDVTYRGHTKDGGAAVRCLKNL